MKLIKLNGSYKEFGIIQLEKTRTIEWNQLSESTMPKIPIGIDLELIISFDENNFLSGNSGIVWATYDLRQAEIIRNALLAQNINSEINKIDLVEKKIFLTNINSNSDINDAINFIWKNESGLQLKPDWNYPENETNESFEIWLGG